MGGHIYRCDNEACGHEEQAYNSCRNRNCPKCQYSAKELWVEERVRELLPVAYYHVVFTVPHVFNELMMYNREILYNLVFQASQEAVKTHFINKYQPTPGIISLLHTWGSNISYHVHTHMLITAGGIKKADAKMKTSEVWVDSKENYIFPVKGITEIYRAIYVKKLRKHLRKSKLKLPASLIKYPMAIEDLIDSSFKHDWVVYAAKPFLAPIHVLEYLGNYTHRIAFSNHRILKIENDRVYFTYKDYKDKEVLIKETSLACTEFCRRYLMHVVPRGFVRIRFYGFMANKSRKKNIEKARGLIAIMDPKKEVLDSEKLAVIIEDFKLKHKTDSDLCALCKIGTMQKYQDIPKIPGFRRDSS